jgi:hypothetical protein
VNEVRSSLAHMSNNSTAFGLRQPHLQRTKLCQLEDAELDPMYVTQRAQLKTLVQGMVAPKSIGSTVRSSPLSLSPSPLADSSVGDMMSLQESITTAFRLTSGEGGASGDGRRSTGQAAPRHGRGAQQG